MSSALRFYRCEAIHSGSVAEWTIGDYHAGGGLGSLGELELALLDGLGVRVAAFVDGRDALREFINTGAFDCMGLNPTVADIEDQLVAAGIRPAAELIKGGQ